MTEAENRASSTSSSRNVWRLAWPSILSYLLFTTVGFLHIKIVAGLGTTAVAAVTTGHRVFFLIQAVLMGISQPQMARLIGLRGLEKRMWIWENNLIWA